MKNRILVLVMFFASVFVVFPSCTKTKLEKRREKSNNNLIEPKTKEEKLLYDIKNFKKETAATIKEHEESVEEFEYDVAMEGAWVKNDYGKRIKELKERNSAMKERIENYNTESRQQWQQFKLAFTQDMNHLGRTFEDFSKESVK